MENVQRAVMLLKPDAHVMGQWDRGATLKLQNAPGGLALMLRMDGRFGTGGVLTLFMKDGMPRVVGAVTSAMMQAQASGVRLADVAGAAVIEEDRFVLRSQMSDWPTVIARYRFALKQPAAARTDVPAETALPIQDAEQQGGVEAEQQTASRNAQPEQIRMPLQEMDTQPMYPEEEELSDSINEPMPSYLSGMDDFLPQQMPYREPEEGCPGGIRQYHIDPFPGEFPGSEWVKISYPGPAGWWHYIFGRTRMGSDEVDVIGVPGEYGMAPPVWLDGFSTWVRCTSGDARGYWLMFQDAQTGRVLDIGRSQRGG